MYTEAETCEPMQCTVRERNLVLAAEAKRINTEEGYRDFVKNSLYKGTERDEKGFWTCAYCQRPLRKELVKCPDCGMYFKGPKPNFPIDYECENCS